MDSPSSIYQSGEYLAHNPDWHESGAPLKAGWIADFLKDRKLTLKRIVEIGCGSGEVLVQLRNFFPEAELEGWDISPQAYAISSPKAQKGIEFHLGEWTPREADLTMAIDVFEHVPDYMGFLEKMKQASGLKLFHIPLDLSVQGLLRGKGLMYARKQVGHIHYFCKDTALATLEDCGFHVLDWRYTHGAEQMPSQRRQFRTRMFNYPRRIVRSINEDFSVRVMGGASMLVLAE